MSTLSESEFLRRPLRIRNRTLSNRLMLAPMVGLTHIAFREVLEQFSSPALLSMEMCSARSLPSERPDRSHIFRWRQGEQARLVCQLVGSEPAVMAAAARRVEQEGFWGVDINMGCSVSAICRQGSGAALLRDTRKALAVVEAVRAAVDIPVSVKFRLGWEDKPLDLPGFCQDLERAGADWLVFHPRLAPDRRSRPLKPGFLAQVKEAVSIPVFGNGDIVDTDSAGGILKSGCDGLAVGRMAVACPWVFSRLLGHCVPEENIFYRYALSLLTGLEVFFPPKRAMRLYKMAIRYVAANFVFGHQLYSSLVKGTNLADFHANLQCLVPTPAQGSRPNIFLFTG